LVNSSIGDLVNRRIGGRLTDQLTNAPIHQLLSLGTTLAPAFFIRDVLPVSRQTEGGLMLRSFILTIAAIMLVASAAVAQDNVATGAQVYVDQKCSMCHSIAGKGNVKGPLDTVGSKYSAADLKAWMVDAKGMTIKTKSARKPEMKNYTLPDADLNALVAYMVSLKK
jgi:mono/diheme cytochrome c family protein